MRQHGLALARLAHLLWHILRGLHHARRLNRSAQAEQRAQAVQRWARRALQILRIELQVQGSLADGPLLLVANHISWLDILVLHAGGYCRFVSKAEVGRWPVLRHLANVAGTLYLERGSRRDALRTVHTMADCLRQGEVLAVFPEGTTSDGSTLLPFHANLLQAAIVAQAQVQPVALSFTDASGRHSRAPCYVGDDSLTGSLWRTLCANGLVARLHYGPPETQQGRERRAWAQELRQVVLGLREPAS